MFKEWLKLQEDTNAITYEGPVQFAKRDIIIVNVPKRQAFYRSSGFNSNKPGVWFPFDGISPDGGGVGLWFDKSRFTNVGKALRTGDFLRKRNPNLDRYGTRNLKQISDTLSQMNIPTGKPIQDYMELNKWINTWHSLKNNKKWLEKNKQDKKPTNDLMQDVLGRKKPTNDLMQDVLGRKKPTNMQDILGRKRHPLFMDKVE